jgi:hypothetical protein
VVEMELVKETGAFSELKTSLALPRQGMPMTNVCGGEVGCTPTYITAYPKDSAEQQRFGVRYDYDGEITGAVGGLPLP